MPKDPKKEGKRTPIVVPTESANRPWFLVHLAKDSPDNFVDELEDKAGTSLANSDVLPIDIIGHHDDYDPRKILEEAGVVFLGEVPHDPLFQYVELPHGWKKFYDGSPDIHLVDDNGNKRALIYCEARTYEPPSAEMHLIRRFYIHWYSKDLEDGQEVFIAEVRDKDAKKISEVLFTSQPLEIPRTGDIFEDRFKTLEKAEASAKEWLDKHYPEWRNPNAYRDS